MLLAGHQANPFPEVARKGTVKHHSVLQVKTGRWEGKKRSYRTRAGGLTAVCGGKPGLYSPQPVCSRSRYLGAKLHCKRPAATLADHWLSHQSSCGLTEQNKEKTSSFSMKNPSHPPVFDNNNNLCYDSNYFRRCICCAEKSDLPENAVLMGHKLKTKFTSQKQEV